MRGKDGSPIMPLRVRVCTWNLAGRPLAKEDNLGSLLAPNGDAADLYAVGTQELVELSVGNIFLATEHEEGHSQRTFEAQLASELGRTNLGYTKVGCVGMVGLFLLVYIRSDLFSEVRDVDCDRVKTGVFKMAGNKGAVCLRFDLADLSFCFMNVHLHCGQENQAARNQDIDDTLRYAFHGLGARNWKRHPKYQKQELSFVAPLHHVVMIFGDMNFRLDLPVDGSPLRGEPLTWLQHDQWQKGLVAGLDAFTEGPITFPPTYKYRLGTDEFDAKRQPAWCDRVLYKALPGVSVQLREYGSLHELRHTSDHKPVAALFEIEPEEVVSRVSSFAIRSKNWLATISSPKAWTKGARFPTISGIHCCHGCEGRLPCCRQAWVAARTLLVPRRWTKLREVDAP